MSTTTEDPVSTLPPASRPLETAPSLTAAQEPTIARFVGGAGLFLLVLGTFAVLAHSVSKTPRLIGEGYGFIAAAFGLALMLYHAARDTDIEMRRLYGVFSAFMLILMFGAGLVPGPVFTSAQIEATMGYNLPWAIGFGLVGLLFLTLYARNETEAPYADWARYGLLGVGAVLLVGAAIGGAAKPEFLAGPGVAVALLGLGFICAYLGQVDTNEGLGYWVGFGLGAFGAAVAYAALARTMFPPLLFDGPTALKKPTGAYDAWAVLGRVLAIAAFLAPVVVSYVRKAPLWLTAALGVLGLIGAGVLLVASFSAPLVVARSPFMVPGGIILMSIGIICLCVSLGICSDSQFAALTRREIGTYFVSPIGYLVLLAMVVIEWFAYQQFVVNLLLDVIRSGEAVIPEPILRDFFISILPVLAVLFQVPALTMRLLAEEKRSGSLEVLLTAPVSEWAVVLSKFLATWVFFIITWLPAGLYLIALRVENAEAFDYRPLLSFYLALAACAAGFVAMGLFLSSVSPNQIVAAVLTLVGMVFFLVCYFQKGKAFDLGPTAQAVMRRLSFIDQWLEAFKGQLSVRDLLAWLSLTVFFLFSTVKVLESRKWK